MLSIVVAAVMAYLLKDVVAAILFEPVSQLWYALSLLYLSVAQIIFWFVLIVIVALIAFDSLYGKFGPPRLDEGETRSRVGPIANTARHISRSNEGIYYKWLIANRLGKLARSIFARGNGGESKGIDVLESRGHRMPPEIGAYLISGLSQTFADYPRSNWFGRPSQTPLDVDVEGVIEYLELQMEHEHD
jgi:hypothetical protein